MNIEYLKYFSELAKIQHYGKAECESQPLRQRTDEGCG